MDQQKFEIIGKDEVGNYDYINNIIIYPGYAQRDSFIIDVFAGETFSIEQPVTYSTLENFKISVLNCFYPITYYCYFYY